MQPLYARSVQKPAVNGGVLVLVSDLGSCCRIQALAEPTASAVSGYLEVHGVEST